MTTVLRNCLVGFLAATAFLAVAQTPVPVGPKIIFAEPVVDFGKIRSGEIVKHSFTFTNGGDQTLELVAVQPQCGCTTTGEWTKRVEPGQTGTVGVQFNSTSFSGQVLKTVTVTSNDKMQPGIVLQMKADIWKPIEIQPQFAVLSILPDATNASTKVRILNHTEEPLVITSAESNNRAFNAVLTTNKPGKEFEVEITAIPPFNPGAVQGQILVKTTSTNAPVLPVTVWANVQPAVIVMPSQITLPPGPLGSKTLPSITIQNNSTNSLTVSDAAINVENVDITPQVLQPGRAFSFTLAFPQGFDLPKGKPVIFSVKTTNPQYSVIQVPILQIPRPVQNAGAATTPAPAAHPN